MDIILSYLFGTVLGIENREYDREKVVDTSTTIKEMKDYHRIYYPYNMSHIIDFTYR